MQVQFFLDGEKTGREIMEGRRKRELQGNIHVMRHV
jgi:hypothetical protein